MMFAAAARVKTIVTSRVTSTYISIQTALDTVPVTRNWTLKNPIQISNS